jgi:hypothetical protein
MKNESEVRKELKNIGSRLADMPQSAPFTLPPGYFEEFAPAILNTVKHLDKDEPVSVIAREIPFNDVPKGYFERLPEEILNLAAGKTATTLEFVPGPKVRIFRPAFIKWAAAAVLLISIAIGSYDLYLRQNTTGTEKMLSAVPGNELHDYLQSNCTIDIDRVINNNTLKDMHLDNKDIVRYLDETGWDTVD